MPLGLFTSILPQEISYFRCGRSEPQASYDSPAPAYNRVACADRDFHYLSDRVPLMLNYDHLALDTLYFVELVRERHSGPTLELLGLELSLSVYGTQRRGPWKRFIFKCGCPHNTHGAWIKIRLDGPGELSPGESPVGFISFVKECTILGHVAFTPGADVSPRC